MSDSVQTPQDELKEAEALLRSGSDEPLIVQTDSIINGKTHPEQVAIPYPKAVYFIIGNEFCERFGIAQSPLYDRTLDFLSME